MHSECITVLTTNKGNSLMMKIHHLLAQTSLLCQVKWCYKRMESAYKRSSAEIWNVTSAENDANLAIAWRCTIRYTIKSSNIEVEGNTFVVNNTNKSFPCADLTAVLDSMMSKVWAEGIAKFCCNTCGKIMAEKRDMKRHLESHLDMSYNCDICKKVCTTSNALRKHYYVHHRSWFLSIAENE